MRVVRWIRDLFSDLRIYFRHGRQVCFLFFLSCAAVIAGAVCSGVLDVRFCLFDGDKNDWLLLWLEWLWPMGVYLLALVVSAFFLLGPVIVYGAHAAVCFLFGCSGYAAVIRSGWMGLAAHALLSALIALTLAVYCVLGAKIMNLSSMIRGKMFGNQRGILFQVEVRRFLIQTAAALLLTLLWTAGAAWAQILVLM